MKKLMMISVMVVVAGCFLASASFAGTPNGSTPSVEAACDGETGAAKGICVAFCEAQDCDENPNSAACDTLRQNWTAATGAASFPCEDAGSLCPCFSKQDILSAFGLVGDPAVETCEQFSTSISVNRVRGVVTQVKKKNSQSSAAFTAHNWPDELKDLQFCETYKNESRTGYNYTTDEEILEACLGELKAVADQFSLACTAQ